MHLTKALQNHFKRLAVRGDKSKFPTAETFAVDACAAGRYVLQFGSSRADITAQLKRKLCHVTAVDLDGGPRRKSSFISAPRLPENVAWFDQILLMELIEHLRNPELFMNKLRRKMARRGSEVIIAASNMSSLTTRLLFRLGSFKHSNGEITRPRSVTIKSLRALLEHTGYEVVETRGLPAPFPLAMGDNRWSRALVTVNQLLLKVSNHFFSHKICIRARPLRKARPLPEQTISESVPLHPQVLSRVA
jgi:methyltransferase family protein